jgi:hypothetical protein
MSTVEGRITMGMSYGGIGKRGLVLNYGGLFIKSDDGHTYRGELMQGYQYLDRAGAPMSTTALDLGHRHQVKGIVRTIEEVRKRYFEAGGTGPYYDWAAKGGAFDERFIDVYVLRCLE